MQPRLLPLFLLLLLFGLKSSAQTYFISPADPIPNDGAWHFFTIPVANADRPKLSSGFGLNRACIDIAHPEASYLTIRLGSPASGDILLADLDGTRGANFTNTCFSMRASRSVLNGSSPFTGTYFSQEFFSRINRDSLASNGNWYLAVKNTSPTDQGTLNGVSISLQTNPAPDPAFVPLCGTQNAGYCHCPDGSDTCDLLPDMTASALIIEEQHSVVGDSLRISNATPNIGWGPMEVHGTMQCYCDTVRVPCNTTACPNGEPPKERVIQRIYRKQGNTMTSFDRDMGFMQYHPSHGHVHVEDWSVYTLRVKNQSNDPLQWPIAATSDKRSYCLVNFGDCNSSLGFCRNDSGRNLTHRDLKNFGFGVVTSVNCGRDQGIFVGHIDIYASTTPGQSIPLTGICTGDYYIVSETDPDHRVLETNPNNNVVAVPIRLNRPGSGVVPVFDITGVTPQVFYFMASNYPGIPIQYVWDFGDGTRDSSTVQPGHTYSQTGTYTVTLTYKGQTCGNVSTTQTIVITSVSKVLPATSFSLKVQPNPATERSVVAFYLPSARQARLHIVNGLGQRVKEFSSGALKEGLNHLELGSHLSPGVYTVLLETALGRAGTTFCVK